MVLLMFWGCFVGSGALVKTDEVSGSFRTFNKLIIPNKHPNEHRNGGETQNQYVAMAISVSRVIEHKEFKAS